MNTSTGSLQTGILLIVRCV